MKTYKANRKGLINYLLIVAVLLPINIFFLDRVTFTENPYILLPLFSPLVLIYWIYLDTYYKIEQQQLIYRSGFLRGRIDIPEIKEIVVGKTQWSGIKPALATNGLLIKFNSFDEVYIAPENNDEMIADLLQLNPRIKVTE